MDRLGDTNAGALHGFARFPAEGMTGTGGITEELGEVREHGLDDSRIARGRSIIVQIDGQMKHSDGSLQCGDASIVADKSAQRQSWFVPG